LNIPKPSFPFYLINEQVVIEKLSFDLKKNIELSRVDGVTSEKANFLRDIKTKPLVNSAYSYLNDSTGRVLVLNGKKNKFIKNIDIKSFQTNKLVLSHICPPVKNIYFAKLIKQLSLNYEKNVSKLFIFEITTKQITQKNILKASFQYLKNNYINNFGPGLFNQNISFLK